MSAPNTIKLTTKPKRFVFNHSYQLRHDLKRTHIFSPEAAPNDQKSFFDVTWSSVIHPVYAMIFSFFGKPIGLSEVVKKLAVFFAISEKEAEELITPFLNTPEPFHTEYNGQVSTFPRNIIIDADTTFGTIAKEYLPQHFAYTELDLEQNRFYNAPQGIVFMVNNTCATNCIYCYADRSVKIKQLSFDRLKTIINQARNLGIATFSLSGGEFFLYKKWNELLDELIVNNYTPSLISTKVPLTEKQIQQFKKYNIAVQISLDSINKECLKTMLNVKNDYAEKIKKTISLLDKYNIPFQIATVLIKENASIDNLEAIYDFIVQFKNISRWEIRAAFKSLYTKADFNALKISYDTISELKEWAIRKQTATVFQIMPPSEDNKKYLQTSQGSRTFSGSKCSANSSHMVLLPDGKVTICEQLYWDSRFVIGDLSKESIKEVWNSSRAIELAFPKQKEFREKSACRSCSIFAECFSFPNKCFADVLKAYGKENTDYPDPRCKKAPGFNNELMYL